jgi:predicted RNase H-related nuclease YkuK (DUF458 family)
MSDIREGKFYNPTKGILNFEEVMNEIINYMSDSANESYNIVVGCDSSSEEKPHFPIAIVVLKERRGGRFFLKKTDYSILSRNKFLSWKERILEETFLSCQLAVTLRKELKKEIEKNNFKLNYTFDYIHADVSKNGITKDMIKEVTALIRGNGFKARIKPRSFAASIVADRFT